MTATDDLLQLGIEPVPSRKSASHGEAGYERKERDFYPTEPWVTKALLNAVDFCLTPGMSRTQTLIWEPACGDGRMAEPIKAAHYKVYASDIGDYGYGLTNADFFDPVTVEPAAVITNPPFNLAWKFIRHALEVTELHRGKVAILQRHEFDAPRSNWPLFKPPFAQKLILPRRPRWTDGPDKASPRFAYAWFLWDWRHQGDPIIRWLPDPAAAGEDAEALL